MLLISSFVLAGCAESQSKEAEPKRQVRSEGPNLILISIDTLCADHLGCYGYDRPTSPAIDGLASEGLLFEDVSTPSPWTLPSHASLLTGLYPNRHGVKSHEVQLPDDVLTLAEVLRAGGFLTAAIVNSHNLSERYGLDRGFEYFKLIPQELRRAEPSEVEDEAVKWLSGRPEGAFFLFLHFYDVHSDYRSLPEYEELFVRDYDGVADGTTAQLIAFRNGEIDLNQADAEHLVDLYDAGIRQMDDGIGRLVELLKTSGLYDETLLIVTSDHGEEFLEHGSVLHGRTHYQEIMHVPLILRGPGVPEGGRIREVASLVDVMPTLLAMLDIPGPYPLDGVALQPTWDGGSSLLPRFIFAEADHQAGEHDVKRAVRHRSYKLHFDRLTQEAALYDLAGDPSETTDIAAEETDAAGLLRERLDAFMRIDETGNSLSPLSPQEADDLRSLGYLQ